MSAVPNHLQPGTMIHADTYRIVRFIAAGGFGCTYEAEHVLLEKRVAIKEFFMQDYCNRDADTNRVTVGTQSMHEMVDKYKRKFIGEAKALSGLRHEGIVSVSDVFEENGTAYFVMDYVKGQSLADLCKNGPLPEKHALYYIRQVCEALAYVHEHNRLHLDLKPANIMVEASGRTVLIDFGASKQYDAASGENTTTLLGYTPGYAPLEQTEGNVRQFLPATDIYALGATLYRLLTGHTPPSPSYRISEEEMQPLPDSISAGTRQAVKQAMMLNKKKRPQTIHEFIALLDAAVKPTPQIKPIPPTPPTPTPIPPAPISLKEPKKKSRKVQISVLLGIIVALCATLIVMFVKGCSIPSGSRGKDTLEDSPQKDTMPPTLELHKLGVATPEYDVSSPALIEDTKETNRSLSPQSAESAEEEVVDNAIVDVPASYPGGENAILAFVAKNLKYPSIALEQDLQGGVVLKFEVKKDGSIGKIKIVKSLSKECDQAAVEVVSKLHRFTPAKQQGRPVPVWFTLPIRFQIR